MIVTFGRKDVRRTMVWQTNDLISPLFCFRVVNQLCKVNPEGELLYISHSADVP